MNQPDRSKQASVLSRLLKLLLKIVPRGWKIPREERPKSKAMERHYRDRYFRP